MYRLEILILNSIVNTGNFLNSKGKITQTKLDDFESNDPKTYSNLVNSLKQEQENSNGPELAIDPNT